MTCRSTAPSCPADTTTTVTFSSAADRGEDRQGGDGGGEREGDGTDGGGATWWATTGLPLPATSTATASRCVSLASCGVNLALWACLISLIASHLGHSFR